MTESSAFFCELWVIELSGLYLPLKNNQSLSQISEAELPFFMHNANIASNKMRTVIAAIARRPPRIGIMDD